MDVYGIGIEYCLLISTVVPHAFSCIFTGVFNVGPYFYVRFFVFVLQILKCSNDSVQILESGNSLKSQREVGKSVGGWVDG